MGLGCLARKEWESETEVDKERMEKKGNITRKFGNVLQTLLYSVLLIGPLSAECKVGKQE